MSTVTSLSPAITPDRRPATVSKATGSFLADCISSHATQRVPLPQAPVSSPSEFQNRT